MNERANVQAHSLSDLSRLDKGELKFDRRSPQVSIDAYRIAGLSELEGHLLAESGLDAGTSAEPSTLS